MTITEAERGIFETLRLSVVSAGCLPDIATTNNATEWQTARDTWKTANPGKAIIDVFGVESPKKRGDLKANTFYINLEDLEPGEIGTYGATFLELVSGTEGQADAVYQKELYASRPEDGVFEIYYFTDSVTMDRIMRQIIRDSLGTGQNYIKGADATATQLEERFLLLNGGSTKMKNDDNFERVHRYVAKDLWEETTQITNTNIKVMTTLDFTIQLELNADIVIYDPPTALTIADETEVSLTLGWTYVVIGAETEFLIESSIDGVNWVSEGTVDIALRVLGVTGLLAGTAALYRVTVRDGDGGSSVPSQNIIGCTLPSAAAYGIINPGFDEGPEGSFVGGGYGWIKRFELSNSPSIPDFNIVYNQGATNELRVVTDVVPFAGSNTRWYNGGLLEGGKVYDITVNARVDSMILPFFPFYMVDALIGETLQGIGPAQVDFDDSGIDKDYVAVLDASGIGDFYIAINIQTVSTSDFTINSINVDEQ